MDDLDAAIRRELDEFCESDMCAEKGKAALLAVLDVHKRNEFNDCEECKESGPGYEAEPARYPCPTVLAIASALEIKRP